MCNLAKLIFFYKENKSQMMIYFESAIFWSYPFVLFAQIKWIIRRFLWKGGYTGYEISSIFDAGL